MIFNTKCKEYLGGLLLKHIEQLNDQLILKLKEQCNGVFQTRSGEFTITKYKESNLIELNWGEKGILQLFSSDGCNISGKLLINVFAEIPDSNRNLSQNYIFCIDFSSANIIFDSTSENFSVKGDIEISYISQN